jgi:Ricin-type beta-trefoil lectin domain-like
VKPGNTANAGSAGSTGSAAKRKLSLTGVSQIQSGATYSLVNQYSSMALDDTNASTANGNKIQQWTCNGNTQQNWTVYDAGGGAFTIVNQLSGKALDDTNASYANGNQIQQWDRNGGAQQNWVITAQGGGAYTVVNQLSGKALDDTDLSYANGKIVQQYDRNGGAQQNWIFVPAGSCNGFPLQMGAAYTLVNQYSSLALDDTNASSANGNRMQQWNCNGGSQQNWVLQPVNGGGYTVVNQLSGKALENGSNTYDGAGIEQWPLNGGSQQSWFLIPQPGGAFTLRNQLSNMALDDTGLSRANGNLLQQWDQNNGAQQSWSFIPAGQCNTGGFSILIDTNQMNNTEANNDSPLAADGVWSIPVNSCSGCIADGISDPNGTWPGALARLNAANWAVSEDTYSTSGYYPSAQLTAQYIGHPVNAAMVYHEQNAPNDTVLTTSEIDSAAAATGRSIIVLSRSYADQRADYVRAALSDYNTSGAAFEQLPDYADICCNNYIQGIQDILASGRKAYLLLPPKASSDYLADMQSGVTQYLASSPQLGNPNLYIVLAVYVRPNQGVGFLQPEPGHSGGNSVLAVRNWLYSYRSSAFRGGH